MDLNGWLEQQGLGKYGPVFAQNEIDEVEILAHLSDGELESLDIPMGARKKIMRALHGEAPPQPQPAYSPDGGTAQAPAMAPIQAPGVAQAPAPAPTAAAAPAAHAAAPGTAASRYEPKGKNSRKATAIFIAVGVHVVLILIATTLTIFAASKDEPEIVAAIAPPSVGQKQEMKKKTVQKQIKRTSSSSAAAAPMAQMMKSSAEASFTAPDVTRTSTGPLGMGEGDFGSGAFGTGNGLGEGTGGSFFGVNTNGQLAVVFDVTRSMYTAVPFVIEEIERSFKTAQVMVVFSGGFEPRPLTRIIPYKDNDKVQLLVEINAKTAKQGAQQSIERAKKMNRSLFKVQRCDSIQSNHKLTRSSKNIGAGFQSLGAAIELLLNQSSYPKTIFVFSDFSDPYNVGYMDKVESLCRSKKVKVVFWAPFENPSPNFKKALPHYKNFARAVDGELKVEALK